MNRTRKFPLAAKRKSQFRSMAACAMGLAVFLVATAAGAQTVTILGRAHQPGEILLVTVEGLNDVASVRGSFLGRELTFFAGSEGRRHALAGIDLEDPFGAAVLFLSARRKSGSTWRWNRTLRIQKKEFATEQLTVDSSYIDLTPEDEKRAERETQKLRALFRTITLERLFQKNFVPPIAGKPLSTFGRRRVFNKVPKSPHSGVDYPAKSGAAVRAVARGKVVLAEHHFFNGKIIVMDHGYGLYSFYIHLSELLVPIGEIVEAGRVIGKVGATGRVTGPHLHWGVKLDGARIDPYSLLALDLYAL